MSAIIINPGLMTTIQDISRDGYAHFGISASGAADPIALQLGNYLLGNKINSPALEVTIIGPVIKFTKPAFIALTGSKFDSTIDGISCEFNRKIFIKKGQTLNIGPTLEGARCYIAIEGGFRINSFLGATTTHLSSGIGGYLGRSLRKEDILKCGDYTEIAYSKNINVIYEVNKDIIRITRGLQSNFFSQNEWKKLLGSEYVVSNQSNRMGIRLEGDRSIKCANEILTEGIPLGAIQVPPSGFPIISFVEHQTTGGYPKIANVISADLPSLGHLQPGDKIKFKLIDYNEAFLIKKKMNSFIDSFIAHD